MKELKAFRILLVLTALCCLSRELMAAAAELKPRHDPPDQLFRRAPMAEAARSVVVNLGGDLYYAFDTDLARVHTVWRGGPLNLWGPPYSYSKDRFICDFEGSVLFSFPPVPPWSAGGAGFSTRFRGIESKDGDVTFSYELLEGGRRFPVQEKLVGFTSSKGTELRRTFVFTRGVPTDCAYLVSAEAGARAAVEMETVKIAGTNGTTEMRGWDRSQPLAWRITTNRETYSITNITEAGTENGLAHHDFSGRETRVFAQIPSSPGEIQVTLVMTRGSPEPSTAPRSRKESAREPLKGSAEQRASAGDSSFRVEHFPLPPEAEMMITGMDFLPGGQLAVCTWLGEIYLIEAPLGPVERATYRRFARGLNEPLGLAVDKRGQIYVTQKGELTRVEDTDGDGVADNFECVSSIWGYSGNYHSYSFGPLISGDDELSVFITGQRGLYDLAYQGWALRVSSDGERVQPFCFGLRVPHGWGRHGPEHDTFVTDNQGNWIGACRLNWLREGKFYGFPSSRPARKEIPNAEQVEPPVLWFPRSLAPSASGIETAASDAFGPFGGQMFIGDFQNSIVMRACLEKVNGRWQGAVFPFSKGFLSGVNRLRFGPDGKLYVGGGKRTWSTAAPKESSLDRVVFTGREPFSVKEVHAIPGGFSLTFTKAIDQREAMDPANYLVKQFTYEYHAEYGSAEFDQLGQPGATELGISGVTVNPKGNEVRLKIAGLKSGYVTAFKLTIPSTAGDDLREDSFYYTLTEQPHP